MLVLTCSAETAYRFNPPLTRSAKTRSLDPGLERPTQLIEAGVDIDFPILYRAMAGLDSIVQAAGRCNREGKLADGVVYVFQAPSQPPPGVLRRGLETMRALLAAKGIGVDLADPETCIEYLTAPAS